jgi:hypothetical protein
MRYAPNSKAGMEKMMRDHGIAGHVQPRASDAAKQAKVGKVMSEYKAGELHSSSGAKVRSRDQAVAIAMSEAGLSRKK